MLDLLRVMLTDLTPTEREQMLRCVADADERGDHWRRDQRRPVPAAGRSGRLTAAELDRIAAQPWRGA